MTELAMRIEHGLDWHDVPGLTTRQGDGAPCPPPTEDLLARRPLRSPAPYRVIGHGVARLIASRGCTGTCRYCGSHALRSLAWDEGKRAGLSEAALAQLQIRGRRRRGPTDVADEVSELYHQREIRIFHLVDDNVVGGDPADSVDWVRRLRSELGRRRVGRTAWSLMIDPASVDDRLLDELERLGVARVLLGVESLTPEGLAALGRPGDPALNLRAVARLAGRGIATAFNVLIIHPAATRQGIERELAALDGVPGGVHVELIPLLVYPGTQAFAELAAQGRLSGGMLGTRYEPDDVVASRFSAVLTRLRLATGGSDDVALYAHEVLTNLAIARRQGLPSIGRDHYRRASLLVDESRRAQLAIWRSAFALAATDLPPGAREQATQALVGALVRELGQLRRRIGALEATLGAEPGRLTMRGNSSILLAVSLAAALGCGGETTGDGSQLTAGGTPGTGGGAVAAHGGSGGGGFTALGGAPNTGGAPAIMGGWPSLGGSSGTGGSGLKFDCSQYTTTCGTNSITEPKLACDVATTCGAATSAMTMQTCFPSECYGAPHYGLIVDASGHVVDVRIENAAIPAEVRDCVLATLAAETFPCLAGAEIWQLCCTPLY
jgi:hypothetical protein